MPYDNGLSTGSAQTWTARQTLNLVGAATGAAGIVGTATLVAGTVTVSTTAVTASSIILVTRNTAGGTIGDLKAPTAQISAGVSFGIVSASGTDTSTVNWLIVN